MAGTGRGGLAVEGKTRPGGRASRVLDAVVAFVVAIFQPIFLVLVSVISPAKDRDQQSQRQKKQQPQQNTTTKTSNHDRRARKKQHHIDSHDNASIISTTSHENDDNDDEDPTRKAAHNPKRMAPPLQNQPSAANRSYPNANNGINTNGQPPVKVALPRKGLPQGGFKQENAPVNGDTVKHTRSNDLDGASATKNGRKYRSLGEEQAEENRHDQLTLPPLALDGNTVEDDVVDQIDEESEDPATAAERAYHTGFMNQALDMVCPFVALIPAYRLVCYCPR